MEMIFWILLVSLRRDHLRHQEVGPHLLFAKCYFTDYAFRASTVGQTSGLTFGIHVGFYPKLLRTCALFCVCL